VQLHGGLRRRVRGEQGGIQFAAGTGASQFLPQAPVTEQLGDTADFGMQAIVDFVWNQQPKDEIHGLAIRRIELYWLT
jgi:hypothetical protein